MTAIEERVERGATPGRGPACEATWTFLGIEAPCGERAAGRFRRACVHEHIHDGWLCRDHAETPENGLCRACWDLSGGMSHECPISLTEMTTGAGA